MARNTKCGPICNIINACIECEVFPDSLKMAEVCPVYKKNDAMCASNYRPISILPCLSKVFEKVVVTQLNAYFENIFSPFLSGFRQGHNCQNVLMRLVENCKHRIDNGLVSGLLLTGLSKAFDSLDYGLLLAKLHAYGLSDAACNLVRSYFMCRKQRVKLGDVKSQWTDIRKGAPQGSLMGPCCFNIFINDLVLMIENQCEIYNYADDNSVCVYGKSFIDVKKQLELIASTLITWFENNHLKANPEKFQVIFFGTEYRDDDKLDIGSHSIALSKTVKLLGVYIDDKLIFEHHVRELCKRAGKKLNALSRCARNLDLSSRSLLFDCFVCSHFNYCTLVWKYCKISDHVKIEKVQKRALKILHQEWNESYKDLLSKSNLTPLYHM